MPDMLDEFEGAEIVAVSFERKNKPIIYTEDRKVFFSHNDEIVAEFNCTLKAEATLFKDGRSGKYKVTLSWFHLDGFFTLFGFVVGKIGATFCTTKKRGCYWSTKWSRSF